MNELSQLLNKIEKAAPELERKLAQDFFRKLAEWCELEDSQILRKIASDLPENLRLWDEL